MISITRYHDICCGHRVVGHEGKCKNLHGHNYRFHLTISPKDTSNTPLDDVGRVLDFANIKNMLCNWLEETWDHKFLVWEEDPKRDEIVKIDPTVWVSPFNPTAENIALYMINRVGPLQLPSDVILSRCVIEETPKCSATVELGFYH